MNDIVQEIANPIKSIKTKESRGAAPLQEKADKSKTLNEATMNNSTTGTFVSGSISRRSSSCEARDQASEPDLVARREDEQFKVDYDLKDSEPASGAKEASNITLTAAKTSVPERKEKDGQEEEEFRLLQDKTKQVEKETRKRKAEADNLRVQLAFIESKNEVGKLKRQLKSKEKRLKWKN